MSRRWRLRKYAVGNGFLALSDTVESGKRALTRRDSVSAHLALPLGNRRGRRARIPAAVSGTSVRPTDRSGLVTRTWSRSRRRARLLSGHRLVNRRRRVHRQCSRSPSPSEADADIRHHWRGGPALALLRNPARAIASELQPGDLRVVHVEGRAVGADQGDRGEVVPRWWARRRPLK